MEMNWHKLIVQLIAMVAVVVIVDRGLYGPPTRTKKKNRAMAPVVYNNLPAGTAIL
jgi:uncharacterized membrane protein